MYPKVKEESLRCHRCGSPYSWSHDSVRAYLEPSCRCGRHQFVCEDENHYRVTGWCVEHFEHLDCNDYSPPTTTENP